MWKIFALLLIIAVITDWLAVYRDNPKLIYIAKPAVMILLIAASLYYGWPLNNTYKYFVFALIFSLLGDIFLMLPKNKFILGLLAFLIAHISYIKALELFPIKKHVIYPTAILLIFIIPLTVLAIKKITTGLIASGKKSLIIPVAIYSITLSLVVLAGLSQFFNRFTPVLVDYLFSYGVILFLISDLLLALDRYVKEIPLGKLKIHMSYHLAQILLTIGFIVNIPNT